MVELVKLDTNAPLIAEDLTLGVLSCTINVEGAIKTYYFQYVKGGLIVNDELTQILRDSFENAHILEGNNGISTHIDSFIPSEVMDSSLIGIRQVGINYIDNTKSTLAIEKIAMKTKLPQALLFYMLDSVLSEYKNNPNILRFELDQEVVFDAKMNGYSHHLQKFVDSRGLVAKTIDGKEQGYAHEDTPALQLAELRKRANIVEGNAKDIQRKLYLEQFSNNIRPFPKRPSDNDISKENTHFTSRIR